MTSPTTATVTTGGTVVLDGAAGTEISFTKPSTVVAGDLILATVTTDGSATLTPAAGWTQTITPLAIGTGATLHVFHRIAAGSTPGFYVVGTPVGKWGGVLTTYHDVDTTTPFDVAFVTKVDATYTLSSLTVPGVTTVTPGAMVVAGIGADRSDALFTQPSGATTLGEAHAGQGTQVDVSSWPTPGATGNIVYSFAAGTAVAAFVGAIRPKAVSAPVTPAPVASFTASTLSGTAPLAVSFTDTSSNSPTSWSWNFGDGSTSTAQNPSKTYAAAGTYTVTLTATNAGGTSPAVTQSVSVAAAQPSGALSYTAEGGVAGSAPTTTESGSGTAFTAITPGAGTVTVDTAHPARGTKDLKFATGATAATPYVEWASAATGGLTTTSYTRVYGYLPANPPAFHTVTRLYSGTTAVGRLQVSTTGTVRYYSDTAAASLGATTWTLPLNELFRLETKVVHAASGTVELRLFTGANVHGGTPSQTVTFTGNTGTGVDRVQYGVAAGNSLANYTIYLDELGWSASAWLGAAAGAPPAGPSITLVTPTSGQTLSGSVTFNATSSDAASIAYYVDGVKVAEDLTTPDFDEVVDTTTLSNGSHVVKAIATNANGSTATPDVTVTVSNGTTTPPSGGTAPVGVPGSWTLTFADEFTGTTLDTDKWAPNWYGEGGEMNNVGTYARNVSVANGELRLQLESTTAGALIHTDISGGYRFPVGSYAEARIYFPGPSSTSLSNWSAWWVSSTAADGWPSSGEHDIAEILSGQLTVNYHSPSGSHNQGAVSGFTPGNSWHTYGVHRKAGSADVYWDGVKVKSYTTDDNGNPEILILNVGNGSNDAFGTAGAMRVDYVRAWNPQA